jgi:hypothetical protein
MELIRVKDRRINRVERRRHPDRRHTVQTVGDAPDTAGTLRELLDDAHARIRMLERTIEILKRFLWKRI